VPARYLYTKALQPPKEGRSVRLTFEALTSPGSLLYSAAQQLLERVSELLRAERVDERIDGRVGVAEPEE